MIVLRWIGAVAVLLVGGGAALLALLAVVAPEKVVPPASGKGPAPAGTPQWARDKLAGTFPGGVNFAQEWLDGVLGEE